MGFREYLRWDGAIAIAVGVVLLALGLAEQHQGPADAAFSGVMLAGTGGFMRWRHKAAFRHPGGWFTSPAVASAAHGIAPCPGRRLMLTAVVQMALAGVVVVGLSFLTGFWLTYMDFAAWAVAIGVIKVGPASAWVAEHESTTRRRYRVAGRPLRGLLRLTVVEAPRAPDPEHPRPR